MNNISKLSINCIIIIMLIRFLALLDPVNRLISNTIKILKISIISVLFFICWYTAPDYNQLLNNLGDLRTTVFALIIISITLISIYRFLRDQ